MTAPEAAYTENPLWFSQDQSSAYCETEKPLCKAAKEIKKKHIMNWPLGATTGLLDECPVIKTSGEVAENARSAVSTGGKTLVAGSKQSAM